MMRREALVHGNAEDLAKQINSTEAPAQTFGQALAESMRVTPEAEVEIYDDMLAPLPGLGIAPAGVVGQ
jgi:acetylglutamate kinase